MARKSIKSAGKLKGETAKKAPPLPAGADQPTNYAEQQGAGTDGIEAVETLQEGIATSGAGFVKAVFGGHGSKLRFRIHLHHRPIGG